MKEKTYRMKHIFIINPQAGSGSKLDETRAAIRALGSDVELYETKAPKDATAYIRNFCESHTESVRFYACGGDGTLKEVAEGILGFPQASMSCFPIGSGNDFVKYYGGKRRFADISALMRAEESMVDMIRLGDEYAINVCSFGFDAAVVVAMNKVRRLPLLGGKNSYTTGIVYALFRAMRNKAEIYADGEKLSGKSFLLCTIANGGYVGGAYRCAPRARNDDGKLEVCLIGSLSIFTFVRLIGAYRDGLHLDDERFAKYITYRRAERVEVRADKSIPIELDGEVIRTSHFLCEAVPGALRFAVPKAEGEAARGASAEATPQTQRS